MGHILPVSLYVRVAVALLALFLLTVGAAFIDLGPYNIVVALTIAVTKAVLVILYFMHVRYSPRVTWVVTAAGFFWLAIMIGLTLSDFLSRS